MLVELKRHALLWVTERASSILRVALVIVPLFNTG